MWNKLSMKDRAEYIKLGVANGITDLSTIRDAYNKYAEGGIISNNPPIGDGDGDGDKRFLGLSGDEWLDVGISMIPGVGLIKDIKEFYDDPSWENAGWVAVSALSEVPVFKWMKIGKAKKAVKLMDKASEAAEKYEKVKKKADVIRATPNINPKKVNRASGEAGRAYQEMVNTTGEALKAKRAAKHVNLPPEISITGGFTADYGQSLYNEYGENKKAEGGPLKKWNKPLLGYINEIRKYL